MPCSGHVTEAALVHVHVADLVLLTLSYTYYGTQKQNTYGRNKSLFFFFQLLSLSNAQKDEEPVAPIALHSQEQKSSDYVITRI